MKHIITAIALSSLISACTIPLPGRQASIPANSVEQADPPRINQNPANDSSSIAIRAQTFSGVLPCADCQGLRITLTVFDNGEWRMSRNKLNNQGQIISTDYDWGEWTLSGTNNTRMMLGAKRGGTSQLERLNSSRLRVLAINGAELDSSLTYTLSEQANVDRLDAARR